MLNFKLVVVTNRAQMLPGTLKKSCAVYDQDALLEEIVQRFYSFSRSFYVKYTPRSGRQIVEKDDETGTNVD